MDKIHSDYRNMPKMVNGILMKLNKVQRATNWAAQLPDDIFLKRSTISFIGTMIKRLINGCDD